MVVSNLGFRYRLPGGAGCAVPPSWNVALSHDPVEPRKQSPSATNHLWKYRQRFKGRESLHLVGGKDSIKVHTIYFIAFCILDSRLVWWVEDSIFFFIRDWFINLDISITFRIKTYIQRNSFKYLFSAQNLKALQSICVSPTIKKQTFPSKLSPI